MECAQKTKAPVAIAFNLVSVIILPTCLGGKQTSILKALCDQRQQALWENCLRKHCLDLVSWV